MLYDDSDAEFFIGQRIGEGENVPLAYFLEDTSLNKRLAEFSKLCPIHKSASAISVIYISQSTHCITYQISSEAFNLINLILQSEMDPVTEVRIGTDMMDVGLDACLGEEDADGMASR